jgi:hypothetical protein
MTTERKAHEVDIIYRNMNDDTMDHIHTHTVGDQMEEDDMFWEIKEILVHAKDEPCPITGEVEDEEVYVFPIELNGEWVGWVTAQNIQEAIDKEGLGGTVYGGFDRGALERMIVAIGAYEPEEE